MPEAYIYDAVRTPIGIGKPNGKLYEVKPIELLRSCLQGLKARNSFEDELVDELIIGCATPVGNQGHNISKAALLYSKWSDSITGLQINSFEASGLDAVNTAAIKISSGWANFIIAGGVESMSRIKPNSDGGPLLFDPEVINSIGYLPSGIAADLMATLEDFTRNELDEFAKESQEKALNAQVNGYFEKSKLAISDANDLSILEKDEFVKQHQNQESLSSLPSLFSTLGKTGFDEMAIQNQPQIEFLNHYHTIGNSAPNADGASLILIGDLKFGKRIGLAPKAKIISMANIGSDSTIMFEGSIAASKKALNAKKLVKSNIDLWEINEPFATPALKFKNEFKIGNDKFNVNGGTIALGNPLGATGAIQLCKLLDELERRDLKTGLTAVSGNAGIGVATIIERI